MTRRVPLACCAGVLATVALTATACSSGGTSRAAATPSGTAVGAESAAVPALPARFTAQKIAWTACGEDVAKDALPEAECGWVEVPVDYAAPDKETIRLRLSRIKAKDQGRRIGSLLNNPGGPGVGGAADVATGAWQPGDAVMARYDVIGFDPRGTGESAPITCPEAKETSGVGSSGFLPRTRAEAEEHFAAAADHAKACQKASGPVFGHMDSESVARDMDVMRAVLGDTKLTYVGTSYGTFIGQKYAQLFPARVGRLVLDSVVDPGRDMRQVTDQDVKVTREGFERYAKDCAGRGGCPLGATAEAAVAKATRLVTGLDDRPLPGGDGEEVDSGAAADAITKVVFQKKEWPKLTRALAAALSGDGKPLARLGEEDKENKDKPGGQRSGRVRSPRPRADADSNSDIAQSAVLCLDGKAPRSAGEVFEAAEELARTSPMFGRSQAWSMVECAAWPVPPTGRVEPITAPGAPPLLLLSYTLDAATPLENARAVQKNLGTASLVIRQGAGHGAYVSGSVCTDRHVDAYLVDGTVPPKNTRCPN